MTPPNPPAVGKRALVLSGGGADGAYGVGVLKALLTGASPSTGYQPLNVEIISGTSVGGFNGAYLAGHWEKDGPATAGNLETVWLTDLAQKADGSNGFYRLLGDPRRLADPRRYFPNPLRPLIELARDAPGLIAELSSRVAHLLTDWNESLDQRLIELLNLSSLISRQPFLDSVRRHISFEGIQRARGRLEVQVVATNWLTGEPRVFTNVELAGSQGAEAIVASGTLPGFFSPLAYGSQLLADGGVVQNTPLRPAVRAGARELHVIYLDPAIKDIPLPHFENTVETLYRMIQIGWAAGVNDDIGDAADINRGLSLLERLAQGRELSAGEAEVLAKVGPKIAARARAGLRYEPLIIHRYRPIDELGGDLSFLNLQPDRLLRLIHRGFLDAVHHDCAAAGCVLTQGLGARPLAEPFLGRGRSVA